MPLLEGGRDLRWGVGERAPLSWSVGSVSLASALKLTGCPSRFFLTLAAELTGNSTLVLSVGDLEPRS